MVEGIVVLRNHSTATVKRYEAGCGWIVVPPGGTLAVTASMAKYLLEAEAHIWERVEPEAVAVKPKAKAKPRGKTKAKAKPKASTTSSTPTGEEGRV